MADESCWTVIRAARSGDRDARSRFSHRFLPVVRAYLSARWAHGARGAQPADVEDAVQEVFVECFRDGGVLERADPGTIPRFDRFLLGVSCNVALRFERRRDGPRRQAGDESFHPEAVVADETSLSRTFDRAFARALVKEAAARHGELAARKGGNAALGVEILRQRFEENRPVREIAAAMALDPAFVHHQYAEAKKAFRRALAEVVAFHLPQQPVAEECARLLELLR